MRKSATIFVVIAALAIGALRPFLPTHPTSMAGSYEAVAHLFVGGLLGAWLTTRKAMYLWVTLALSILEVICFAASR